MGRKKSSVGCLFWIALILLVLVVFLFNRNTIETVLRKTGLMNYVARDREPVEKPEVEIVSPDRTSADESSGRVKPRETAPESDTENAVVVQEEPTETSRPPTEERIEAPQRVRRSRLYFVLVDENSAISLREVTRAVSFTDSPLTDTLHALLKGLSSSEISRGLLSMVPEGTELRSVVVRGSTAYIDFNEAFRFNTFGREGYRYQLQQIVYTATEFQTVRSVQILVEGERISYLGPESPFVGEPLTRESLS